MNLALTNELIITYILYWFFLFYITKWMKDFQGASRNFYLFLTYYSGLGTIFGFALLGSIAYSTNVIDALILMVISIVSNMILVLIESTITLRVLKINYSVEKIGMVSLFVVPVVGYRLFMIT